MTPLPLSHTRTHNGFVFVSGQVGLDELGRIPPDLSAQARLAIESLRRHLAERGGSLASVVKTTVFLARQADFAAMNEIYAEYFTPPSPARSTLVVGLVKPAFLFEIEAIAYVGDNASA